MAPQSTNPSTTRTFESPTDLLYRILLAGPLIFNAEGGPPPVSPFPIPVLSPAEYYSLTAVERADYHMLQKTFGGEIEVPGLEARMPREGEVRIFAMDEGLVSVSAPASPRGEGGRKRVMSRESGESGVDERSEV